MSATRLVGTLPAPRLETIEWKFPGGMTVTMVGYYLGTNPNIGAPTCPVSGVKYVGFETNDPMDGGFGTIRWTYMGGVSDGGGGGGGGGGSPDYDVRRTSMTLDIWADQVPLTMHPKIDSLMKAHGGTIQDGQLNFPLEDPSGKGTREGVDAEGNSITLNPLYGVTSYFAPRAMLKLRTFGGNPETDKLGFIDTPPWDMGGGKNSWLKSGANSRNFGGSKEVVEEWLFSSDGWSEMLYKGT
jgi:hypothetical protein